MKTLRAIFIGALLWLLIFIWWSILIFAPIIKEMLTLQYIIHYILLIITTSLVTGLYYKSNDKINGFLLGLVFFVVGIILDAIITVPLFTIPQGTGYTEFFFAPLMLIDYAILIMTVGIYDIIKNK